MNNSKLAIVGLGYVGLPLACAFSRKYEVVGFDISRARIDELNSGYDKTLEVDKEQLKAALDNNIKFTCNLEDTKDCNIYIVSVPTPVDAYKQPNLNPLIKASESVGKVINRGDIVIYESTVYPGVTEEVCAPVLERYSGLKFNKEFFCGYSPERINPGDKNHRLENIKKITSGSTKATAMKVDALYASIIKAGTHPASSIKVAEAAKVIENSQRDINIAFVNELAIIFDKLGIDTKEVLEAAGTKWNFLPFRPGLVGGHCIGVDPYYLTHKAQEIGYNPEVILSGRRINDNMGVYAADRLIKIMIQKGQAVKDSNILLLGITFKENCPDIRNSRVIDVIKELKEFGCNVDAYDPWADKEDVKKEYGIELIKYAEGDIKSYDALILAVAHDKFREIENELADIKSKGNHYPTVYDIKSFFDKKLVDGRL